MLSCFVLLQNHIRSTRGKQFDSTEIFPPSITRAHQGLWRDRDLKGMTGKAVVQGQLCQDVQLLLRFVMKGTLYPVRLPPFRKSRNARPPAPCEAFELLLRSLTNSATHTLQSLLRL